MTIKPKGAYNGEPVFTCENYVYLKAYMHIHIYSYNKGARDSIISDPTQITVTDAICVVTPKPEASWNGDDKKKWGNDWKAQNNNDVSYTSSPTASHGHSFYYIDILGITLNGTQLPISSSLFSSAGAIIDSGTVITRLPPTVYATLRDSFQKGMSKYPRAEPFSLFDTCYDLSGVEDLSIPQINFVLGGGVTVELVVPGILYTVSSKQLCLAFAANRADTDLTIFGNVQQRTLEVVYDVGGGRIGFASNGCN